VTSLDIFIITPDSVCRLLQEFFLMVKDIVRRSPTSGPDSFAKWTGVEKELNIE